MPAPVIVIPRWVASQLNLEELGLYTVLADLYDYQEIQPDPGTLSSRLKAPLPKIRELLNSLVSKQILIKGTKAYRLVFDPTTNQTSPTPPPAAVSEAATNLVTSMIEKMPELKKALGTSIDGLPSLVDETLKRGISPSQIFQAIGSRTLVGVDNPIGALSYRLRGIIPAGERIERKPCPLHRGHHWDACPCCKGEIKEGFDPYQGREGMRPSGWSGAYPEALDLIDEEADKAAREATQ